MMDSTSQPTHLHQLFKRFVLAEGAGSTAFRRCIQAGYEPLKQLSTSSSSRIGKSELDLELSFHPITCSTSKPGNETPDFTACI